MKKKGAGSIKKKIALTAVLVGGVLSFLTFFFIQGVQKQLWEQSIRTIMESTQQGCNTLRIQLHDDYESMESVMKYIKEFSIGQKEELGELLDNYGQVEKNISLYLPDGTCIPADSQRDEEVERALAGIDKKSGIINPHISSVTGVNVIDLFVKVTMQDGTEGYLLKEYEVNSIVDSFTLSFYNNAGFSYVINTQGDVLIRSPHPNSNKTVKNLFDMLPKSQNNPDSLAQFAQSLKNSNTGWAVFTYQGEKTVFCYTPLKLQSDWYLIAIIPQDVVNAQTNEILIRALTLIGCIILGISMLLVFYLQYENKTNRKLINQADYIRHLFNAVPEGIAVITVELPHRFVQLNQEGLRLLNYQECPFNDTPNQLCLQDIIHPDDYEEIAKLFKNTAMSNQKNVFEIRVLKADGDYFWAAGIVEKTLDENGKQVFIITMHDITDEKTAKEAAEREKLQERITLVGAISNAYPVIVSLNLTKNTLSFIYIKSGLMLRLGEQKLYSELFESMLSTIHPDSIEKFKCRFSLGNLRKTLGQEKSEVFLEAKQMLSDGNYHWTSTQIIHVDNPYSEDRLAILISRCIDEQRYEEEQQRQALQSALDNAKAASEAKSQFLSNMSHDIRTPMNAIVGMTAIAITHLDNRERVMECLNKISLSSKHLLSLINDILDMAKIESGKLSLRDEPFNFAELVADAVELVRPQSDVSQLKMDVHLEMLKNEKVLGDPLRIRQVFINILSNAIKYTPAGGSIHIEVKQESSSHRGYQSYIFCCADTGIGMGAEFLKKLFQPFERAQDFTTSRITGTGLGMVITKNIIDLMNGDIWVESKPGEGSVFTVMLPLQLQDAEQAAIPQEWQGVHSLIVDSNKQMGENTAELFKEMGLCAQYVTEGKTAVKYVVQAKDTPEPFQLIMIDRNIMDINGIEVARRIRKETGGKIPVIILTAYDWSDIESEARDAGVTAFLSKPLYRSKICHLLCELSGEKNPIEQKVLTNKPTYASKRVLVVEDNAINREIAWALLEELGVQVEEARDGEEAARKVMESEEGYYDLILMDIQMPKMDGYEATQAIRLLERQDVRQIPIVAMTANAFEEDIRAALRAGMNEHFAKPIDVKALQRLLHKYLANTPSKEE